MRRQLQRSVALRAGLLASAAALIAAEPAAAEIDAARAGTAAGSASAAEAAAAESAIALDEVVVTAQKRATNLQGTPIAMAVMGSEALANRHVQSLGDLSDGAIPSLRIAPFFSRSSALLIGMRGIGLGDANQPARDQAVGVYIDGRAADLRRRGQAAILTFTKARAATAPPSNPVREELMDRREFLMAAAGGGVLAFAPAAFARPAYMDAQASRTGPEAVRLEWSEQKRPVSILVSADADAPRQKMQLLKTGVSGAAADLPAPVAPRPYFLLSTPDGAQVRVAERLLPLQGGRNFRDLGGYRSADGRQVRWGRLYRSGVMSGLTEADMSYLSALGVKVICDLRSNQERTHEPNPFIKAAGPVVAATDYDMISSSALSGLGQVTTREAAIDAFAAAYVQFTEVLTPQYTDMFARLKRGDAPLAFNCSAGKDRTGVAAALILSVLDVPRETILADYGLTEVYTPPSMYMKQAAQAKSAGFSQAQAEAFMRMPREVVEVMLGSDPAVMRKALATIDAEYGGPVALVKGRFGVSDADIAALRRAYLV